MEINNYILVIATAFVLIYISIRHYFLIKKRVQLTQQELAPFIVIFAGTLSMQKIIAEGMIKYFTIIGFIVYAVALYELYKNKIISLDKEVVSYIKKKIFQVYLEGAILFFIIFVSIQR